MRKGAKKGQILRLDCAMMELKVEIEAKVRLGDKIKTLIEYLIVPSFLIAICRQPVVVVQKMSKL